MFESCRDRHFKPCLRSASSRRPCRIALQSLAKTRNKRVERRCIVAYHLRSAREEPMRMDRKWPFDPSVLAAAAFAVYCSLSVTSVFAAEPWPVRPVRVIVPHPAGGSVDAVARMVTRRLADVLGKPFVVENRGGANGNIGAAAAAGAPPDGYTLLLTTTGPLVFN